MPAIQRSDFALALNQIATERGIDPQDIIESIKTAILAAFRKDHITVPADATDEEKEKAAEGYTADLNSNTGETRILHEGKDVTPPGFGRIATQTAKQVLLQKIREREKDAVMAEYEKRVGTVVNGMILRFAGPVMIVDIGKAEAVLPPSQKIQSENYHLNKKIAVYVVEIAEDEKRGREIVVSRSHNGLLEGLLKREVPEVASGSVTVKAIAREPGSRAKIAVYSDQSGIDPVGSCVGQKGVRIQAVIDELDGLEKIDVIQWNPDTAKFIENALSPAKNLTIEIDEDGKKAVVKAPKEELPLIIGKEGQNVRLASKLTEHDIEVEGTDEVVEDEDEADSKEKKKEEKKEDKKDKKEPVKE